MVGLLTRATFGRVAESVVRVDMADKALREAVVVVTLGTDVLA